MSGQSPTRPTRVEEQDLLGTSAHHDPQLAQDIDAARQMSRARAGSIDHRGSLSPTSPRVIPGSQGSRPSEPPRHTSTTSSSNVHDYARRSPAVEAPWHGAGSYVSRSPMPSRYSQQHQSQSQQQQPQAARFYMQRQRQGSNASLDSASHFIDHRNQPHSISMSGANAPSTSMRTPSHLAQAMAGRNENAVDDETLDAHVNDLSGGRSPRDHRTDSQDHPDSHQAHTPMTMSRRPSALEDDVCFPQQQQQHQQQHQQGVLHGEFGGEEYPDHSQAYDHMEHDLRGHPAGNLPPGFPFTFDLRSLEEYAQEERVKLGSSATRSANAAPRYRSRPPVADTDEGRDAMGGSTAAAAAYGISPDSDDATFYSRRPRKHNIAASSNIAGTGAPTSNTNRYQRKLAMFESGGAAPPGQDYGDNYGGRATDANTPLLGGGGDDIPSYNPPHSEGTVVRDTSADEAKGRLNRSQSQPGPNFPGRRGRKSGTGAFALGAAGLGAPTPADKPYRFTFYSNALPSTIHARHLAELPAKGQSFEELFAGLEPGALGGSEEDNVDNKSGETTAAATAHEENGANGNGSGSKSGNGNGNGKPDASQLNSTSALTAQLAARGPGGLSGLTGRREGSTAPPTRTGTPAPGSQGPRTSMNLDKGVSGLARMNTGGGGPTPPNASAARTVPGGGIRMDQDPEANTWWLDVLSPTDAEMKLLSRVFGIHPLTTEDILMEETREKIELFRNYYLVCFRSFDQDPYSPTYLEPLNMYIIVFREGTLSFHFRATPHPQNVRRRIKQLKDYINVTSDWISYALIDDITDAFGPLIQSIEYEVDSIDELVLILKDVEQSDMLRRIGACRKKVMGLLRLMGNKADVVKGLAKRCNENWSVAPKSDIGLYLSDIQDHLITMTQNLSHFEKILSRSHSNYLAQISIEMTEANNRANDVLSKLTALGTVIVPLNVITGLWGMNVNVPGQGVENLHWFTGLVCAMAAIGIGGYYTAVRYMQT